MLDWYQTNIVDTGRSPILWALIGFVVTFGIVRWITLRIRSRKESGTETDDSAIKDVIIGGVHIHHQVWGILLVLISGLLEFRYRPGSPWQEILGALFGVGAALALDEFALWLHLEDVYWSDEGRKSIDAVMIAVVVFAGLFIATSPVGLDSATARQQGSWYVVGYLIVHFTFAAICLLKGKIVTGLIGLPVPIVAVIGTFRLAKPESFWAKRYYKNAKLDRATSRHQTNIARRDRVRDTFSGVR
jgi:hypothetical protein